MLTIYKASAGSGKTFTLARDYIQLLLGIKDDSPEGAYSLNFDPRSGRLRIANRHRGILAITFTRKATEEMKTRIIHELERLTVMPAPGADDSDYADYMCQTLRCTRQHLADAAAIALRQLLFDYQNFNVSTIDAFFQRVLHTFARELDRQSDYQIELDDKVAMREAVGALLDDFNSSAQPDSSLADWLYDHMNNELQRGHKANLFNRRSSLHRDLVEEMSMIGMESFKDYAADMRKYLADRDSVMRFGKQLRTAMGAIVAKVKHLAEAAVNYPADPVDPEWFDQTKKPYTRLYNYMLQGVPLDNLEVFNGSKKANDIRTPGNGVMFKKGCGTDTAIVRMKAFYQEAYLLYIEYFTYQLIANALPSLGLLAYAWSFLERLNLDNNRLLLSDTNELIHRIIGGEEMPFVYERLGVQLRHFLIDEFQDTSKKQWDNLHPLVSNGVAQRHDSLVIGDEKQSIYRFRNSDSSILRKTVVDQYKDVSEMRGMVPKENTNYRSCGDIVQFNNTLFALLAQTEHVAGYDNVVQGICDKLRDKPAYVCLQPHPKKTADCPSPKEVVLKQMAEQIIRQHQSNYDWRDIAILVNANGEAADIVKYLLLNYPDISVQSDEALRLVNSQAVQMVVSALRILDQETDAEARRRAREVEQQEKPDKKHYPSRAEVMLALNRVEYFIGLGMPEREAVDHALQSLTSDDAAIVMSVQAVKRLKPASLVAMVETIIGLQYPAGSPERRDQFTYLAAFQDVVMDFCQRNNGTLHAFMDWWATNGKDLNVGSAADTDAVRVMTIHKSKGLEFKCVHIPFCTWSVEGRTNSRWTALPPSIREKFPDAPKAVFLKYEKAICDLPESPFYDVYCQEHEKMVEDSLNKTYVAFTRACVELMVWYDNDKNSMGALIAEMLKQPAPDPADPNMMNLSAHFDTSTGTFTLGEPTTKTYTEQELAKIAAREEAAKTSIKPSYDVHFRVDTSRITNVDSVLDLETDIDDDSARTDKPASAMDSNDEARKQGIVLHDIMARIRRPADMDRAIDEVARRRRLGDTYRQACRQIVSDFLGCGDARVQSWFDGYDRVLVEQPIYVYSKDFTRRPDRLVFHPDGIVDVVDYKFTWEEEHIGSPEQLGQVREYMSLLRDMGHGRVRGFLAYPRLSQIIQVTL